LLPYKAAVVRAFVADKKKAGLEMYPTLPLEGQRPMKDGRLEPAPKTGS
jgi:hypothetical protein